MNSAAVKLGFIGRPSAVSGTPDGHSPRSFANRGDESFGAMRKIATAPLAGCEANLKTHGPVPNRGRCAPVSWPCRSFSPLPRPWPNAPPAGPNPAPDFPSSVWWSSYFVYFWLVFCAGRPAMVFRFSSSARRKFKGNHALLGFFRAVVRKFLEVALADADLLPILE